MKDRFAEMHNDYLDPDRHNKTDVNPPNECPLCGSSNVEIRYIDDGIEPMTGYAMAGYVFECFSCGEHGEWE